MSGDAVSVIIPTYNRAALVGRAIASVLAAIGPDDEVIVVDDGSTDDTPAAVRPFGDRVRFLPMPHGGAGVARNHGLDAASRPLVGFLDSDDEWDADKLHLQRTVMRARPDVLFCFSDFRGHEADGRVIRNQIVRWHNDPRPWDQILGPSVPFSTLGPLPPGRPDFPVHVGDLYPTLVGGFYVAAQTLLVRREPVAGLRFAVDLEMYEDLEYFALLARAGPAAYLDCETATQYGHAGPRLTDANGEILARCRLSVLDRVWGRDPSYLAAHGEAFRRTVREQHLIRARWLMCRGRNREARAELASVADAPAGYRLLSRLPGFATRWLLAARRLTRGG